MAYDPAIKLLLRWKRQILVWKAKEFGLETNGTKLELAIRIAKFQEEESAKAWISISNPLRSN